MSQFQFADEKPKDTPETVAEPASKEPAEASAQPSVEEAGGAAPATFNFADVIEEPKTPSLSASAKSVSPPQTTADTPKTPLEPTVAGAPESAAAQLTPSGQKVQNTAVRHPPAPAIPQNANTPAARKAPQKAEPQAPTPPPVATKANAPVAPVASGATPVAPKAPQSTRPHGGTPGMMQPKNNDVIMLESKTTWDDIYLKIEPVVFWVFRMGSIVTALSLLYLLFAIFSGGAGAPVTNDPGSAEAAAKFAGDINTVSRVFQVSFLLTMFAMGLMLLEEKWVGAALAVAGVVMAFAVPIGLKGVGETPAMSLLSSHMRQTGFTLLLIGLVKYGFDLYRWFAELPERAKAKATVGNKYKAEPAQARIAEKANMMSPCWKLPFCREVIRNQCPAFLAKKRCWKFGRGCYCDEEMVARIIRGESLDKIKAPTRQSQAGKPPCGGCHIYLEHQSLKYKMLSPMAVPVTALAGYLLWKPYSVIFNAGADRLDSLWARMSFSPESLAPSAIATDPSNQNTADVAKDAFGSMTPDQMQSWALVMFGVILGFFLLIYVSKAIEAAIYRLGW